MAYTVFKQLLTLLVFTAANVKASAPGSLETRGGALPSPWISFGCFTDNTASRSLKIAATSDVTGMTIEECLAFCTPAGYTFAGVEFGRECYCDNIIEATGVLASGGCNMPCTGDSTEICGGSNRINIFKNTVPAGWTSIGCYTDNPFARGLRVAATTDVFGMTIEECTSFCTPAGYQFAGVEFSRECFCDNVIQPTSIPATDGCNMTCTGDSNEICGGANRINIYNHTSLTHPPPTAPVPTIRQTVGTFQYKGCFLDGVNGTSPTLEHRIIIPGGTSLESCTSACQAAGFAVAGVEFGHECWCDSYMAHVAHVPDSDCNLACQGPDISQICGATNRLAVYVDSTATPPSSTACLNLPQFLSQTQSFRFDLQATPSVGGGSPSPLGVFFFGRDQDLPAIYPLISSTHFQPVSRSFDAVTFNFANNTIWPDALGIDGIPVAQTVAVGSEQSFIAMLGKVFQPFSQYCVMPNPLAPFGPFIGPPTIAVNGRNDLWALCTGLNLASPTIFFQPQPTSGVTCQSVVLAMIYPSTSSTCNGC